MKMSIIAFLVPFHIILSLASSFATPTTIHENFLQCLSLHSDPSIPIYGPNSTSYSSILQFSVRNLRFSTPTTPKPQFIITALHESHVQVVVVCSRKYRLNLRTRSGGHDYEGLSYATDDVPFVVVDLLNLQSISVDAKKGTAWVQAGATIGQLYHNIAVKSRTYGFPAGGCPTVGVGGHLGGGGYGTLLRKYGLAADHIVDVRLVNVDGKILDRKSMGEDHFWAIKGGGGSSFGVVLSYKINLVHVPPVVTFFIITKNLEEGATALVERWQYVADKLPQDLIIEILINVVNSTQRKERTVQASFRALFLGGIDKLIPIMEQRFPELGLTRKDCTEMSWIQSVLNYAGFPINASSEVLVDRTPSSPVDYFKAKSDYVKEPISETRLEEIWKMLLEKNRQTLFFTPYGGRMSEISESSIPFPHRAGNIYMILYLVNWEEKGLKASKENIASIRRLYRYLTPYVSKFPRSAYFNYRDLDLGQSKNGTASYSEAKVWGIKYFKSNFDRLVKVKSKVDPGNFFRNEQSIPTIPSWEGKKTY